MSFLSSGYVAVQIGKVNKFEHVLVAEKALGKPLPPKAVVHHVNENRTDNRTENLVICPDRAYHNLIHRRMRALAASGHADWLLCNYCKRYDDPSRLLIYKQSQAHAACPSKRKPSGTPRPPMSVAQREAWERNVALNWSGQLRRARALAACGNSEWRKCKYCKQHDDPDRMAADGGSRYHRECRHKGKRS